MAEMTPGQKAEHARDLAEMLAAYNATLDEVVTETQQGTRKEDPDKLQAYGDIMQRAHARRRARERRAEGGPA